MSSPFINGIIRGLKISAVLVIFYLLLDFFYFSKLEEKNTIVLECNQSSSIGGEFDLVGKNGKIYRVTITGDNLTYRNLHEKKGEFTTILAY